MRLILAAILGGLAMFLWSAFSHMVLGVGELSNVPAANEAQVLSTLKTNVPAAGAYIVPGMDMTKRVTDEEMAAWAAKYKEGPTAILIYHPDGEEAMTIRQLCTELLSNILCGALVAIVLSFAAVGFGRGVAISTMMGLAGWMSIEVSYWTWFRFPLSFVRGELIDQTVGFFVMGLVIAALLRKKSAVSA